MSDQKEKFARLKALHDRETAFVIPNPWDAGSARLLTSLGFEALATTSAGYAFSKGKRDSFASLSRREILENAAEIAEATDLPVSADLEDGFGAAPETCAETIRMACKVGLVGGLSKTQRAIRMNRFTSFPKRLNAFARLQKLLAICPSC
ncbi:2-methylisocitrate lyase-like PEP mutase family enzyme [Ensifer sp. 4252]